MDASHATGYSSGSQIARRITEAWGEANLYCAACTSSSLSRAPCNTKAVDFICPTCSAPYQLKARKQWNEHRVPDAAYDAMMAAVLSDRTPNLLVMQYSLKYSVVNLMLIPSFFFSPASVEKRRPLAPTARRAGWVGCNINLDVIASQGKLRLVHASEPIEAAYVREQYRTLRPLANLDAKLRGWTLDILCMVQRMPRIFTLNDAYAREKELMELYPANRFVRPKIRQQLQVLRDLGFIRVIGRGNYELIKRNSPVQKG